MPGERMVGRHEYAEFLVMYCQLLGASRGAYGTPHDRQIKLAALQQVELMAGAAGDGHGACVRSLVGQQPLQPRHEPVRNAGGQPDPQRALGEAGDAPRFMDRQVGRVQRRAGVREQRLPGIGERRALPVTDQKRGADLGFEPRIC